MKFDVFVLTIHFVIEVLNNRNELSHHLRKESYSPQHDKDDKHSLWFINRKQVSISYCC